MRRNFRRDGRALTLIDGVDAPTFFWGSPRPTKIYRSSILHPKLTFRKMRWLGPSWEFRGGHFSIQNWRSQRRPLRDWGVIQCLVSELQWLMLGVVRHGRNMNPCSYCYSWALTLLVDGSMVGNTKFTKLFVWSSSRGTTRAQPRRHSAMA